MEILYEMLMIIFSIVCCLITLINVSFWVQELYHFNEFLFMKCWLICLHNQGPVLFPAVGSSNIQLLFLYQIQGIWSYVKIFNSLGVEFLCRIKLKDFLYFSIYLTLFSIFQIISELLRDLHKAFDLIRATFI